MAFSWKSLLAEVLEIGPGIIGTVFADKTTMSNETKLAAATQAIMQASTVVQQIDPNDTQQIQEATASVSSVVAAFQTQPPNSVAATAKPVSAEAIAQATPPEASAATASKIATGKAQAGTGSGTGTSQTTTVYRIDPKDVTMGTGEVIQFSVYPTPPKGASVSYSGSGMGSVSSGGLYNSGATSFVSATGAGTGTVSVSVNGQVVDTATVTVTT